MGKRRPRGFRKLSPDLKAGLLRDYELYRNNQPKRLAGRYGISEQSVYNYVRRARMGA